jgi:hypothetical protein
VTLRTPVSASPAGSRSGEGDAVGDGVAVGVDGVEGEGLAAGVGVAVGVGEAVAVGVGEGVSVGAGDGVAVGVCVADPVGTDGSVAEGAGDSVPERLLQPDRTTSRSSPIATAVLRGCPMEGMRRVILTLKRKVTRSSALGALAHGHSARRSRVEVSLRSTSRSRSPSDVSALSAPPAHSGAVCSRARPRSHGPWKLRSHAFRIEALGASHCSTARATAFAQ